VVEGVAPPKRWKKEVSEAVKMSLREVEDRLEEIESLEDCGIRRTEKVQREYERLSELWKKLDQEDRDNG
jgi:hypothetical protein